MRLLSVQEIPFCCCVSLLYFNLWPIHIRIRSALIQTHFIIARFDIAYNHHYDVRLDSNSSVSVWVLEIAITLIITEMSNN